MLEHDVQWLAKFPLQKMYDQLQNQNRLDLGPK